MYLYINEICANYYRNIICLSWRQDDIAKRRQNVVVFLGFASFRHDKNEKAPWHKPATVETGSARRNSRGSVLTSENTWGNCDDDTEVLQYFDFMSEKGKCPEKVFNPVISKEFDVTDFQIRTYLTFAMFL